MQKHSMHVFAWAKLPIAVLPVCDVYGFLDGSVDIILGLGITDMSPMKAEVGVSLGLV